MKWKVHIEKSPYGDEGATYDGALGMLNHFVLQLKSFRENCRDLESLEKDIQGYEELIKMGSEKAAEKFLEIKQSPEYPEFNNNLEVLAYMKEKGLVV